MAFKNFLITEACENKEDIIRNIKAIQHHCDEILEIIENVEVEEWMQNKIAISSSNIADVSHAMDGQL